MRFSRWCAAIGAGVIVLGLAVGCSSGKQKSDSASAPAIASGTATADAVAPNAAEADASEQAGSLAVDTAGLSPADVGRQVVSTATVTLRADDIAAAKQQAAAAAGAAGGFVYAEQGQYGDHPSVTVTLKVPPDHFSAVLASISKLGDVDSQQITTDDVTDQAIDLDSRIATTQVSVERLRGFLDKATTVTDVANLESELLRRETDLEKLRAQKRSLDGRVDSATIVLTVQPPPVVAPPVDRTSGLPGFVDGLAAGWRAFVNTLTVVLVVLGALLPFVPVAAAVVAGAWWWRRRARPAESAV